LHKLTRAIGAEVTGVDLRGPLNEIERAAYNKVREAII
jgi:hypothetical protein